MADANVGPADLGDVADCNLPDGLTTAEAQRSILLDQSMLTGESLPIEGGPGLETYTGALVRRGEVVVEVITATGPRAKFGRPAELIRNALGAHAGTLRARRPGPARLLMG